MKKYISAILAVLMIITLAAGLTVAVGADFGDFSGDDDFGGDFGGDDFGGDFGGDDWSDWDDDFSSTSSSVRSAGRAVETVAGVIIIIVIFVFAQIASKNRKTRGAAPQMRVMPQADETLFPMESYSSVDPKFSEESMKEFISNSYVRLQKAWQAKDLSAVQTLLSDAYFAQMSSQVEAFKRSGRTNVIDRPAVMGVTLLGWKTEGGCDVMVANIRARITDYVISDDTGDVVGGDPDHQKFMEYEWRLSRTSGVKTAESVGTRAANCPNCGAPIDLNKSAVCPYCDSVIKTDRHDWVINTIKAISQTTMR